MDMVNIDDLIEGLANYYEDLGYQSFINQVYKDFRPDLRVESEEGPPLIFKVHSVILDLNEVRVEWVTYDESYRSWWLCVPEQLQETVDEIIEELDLENVEICFWDEDGGEIYFYDIPDPADD